MQKEIRRFRVKRTLGDRMLGSGMLQGEETKELLTVEWQGIAHKVQQVRMLMDKMPEKRVQIAISAISKMQTAMAVAVRAIRGEA